MAYLEIIDGINEGATIPITDRLSIGRGPENGVCLADTSISRKHAEICKKENYFTLIDLGSANGTFVNNMLLHKLVPRPLYNLDEVIIGTTHLVFHCDGEEPPGPTSTASSSPTPIKLQETRYLDQTSSNVSVVLTSGQVSGLTVNATMDASRHETEPEEIQAQSARVLSRKVRRLEAIVKVSNELGEVTKPERLLERIMDSIFDIFPHADRAFIMLWNKNDNQMVPIIARRRHDEGKKKEEFAISNTILTMVMEQKQSILSSDALNDERFADKQSVVDLSIRSIMCSPFVWKDELLGVIGIDTLSGRNSFNEDDLAMLTGIAAQAAIALKNSELYVEIEKESQVRTQLSRYLSSDIVEGVIAGTIPLRLGGEKKKGTILFADIVGFATIAEHLTAIDTIDKINKCFSIFTGIISRNKGTLHKFGGDMALAFWNVMVPDPNAEENAVRTGLEMQNAIWLFNLDLQRTGQNPIYMGIGCNTGDFAGGNIGGDERMEYTVVGDNVNLAQRIESLACRWQVLVSHETFIPMSSKCIAIDLPAVAVKGRTQRIRIFSIRGFRQNTDTVTLSIPVHIFTPDGKIAGGGMLMKYRVVCGTSELHLSTLASIPPWDTLTIQFDMPELTESLQLSGRVAVATRSTHGGNTVYSRISLSDIKGDEKALSFLNPGTIIESKKNWADMKRH